MRHPTRAIVTIVAAAFAIAAIGTGAPTPVIAGTYDMPMGCANTSHGNKQAVKTWAKKDFLGNKEFECGSSWANGGTATDWRDRVVDHHWGTSSGYGIITSFNDRSKSLVLINRNSNYGACFTFYPNSNFHGGALNARFSIWVPRRKAEWGHQSAFVQVRNIAGQNFQSGISSLRDWPINGVYGGWGSHNTHAECEADSIGGWEGWFIGRGLPPHQEGYVLAGGQAVVIWP